jgi:predicted dienelactone hydrolase
MVRNSSVSVMRVLLAMIALSMAVPACARTTEYDPLRINDSAKSTTLDLVVMDVQRQREIPLRVFLPATTVPAPVLLFSHGLGGTREGNPYLGEHWSARGYLVVVMQHHGSDDAVWKAVNAERRMAQLRQAASIENALLRFRDVAVVIDQLEKWQRSGDSAESSRLTGRMNLSKLGMSGHSFGAVTAQAVGGQRSTMGDISFTDPRIKAAVIMSPNAPRTGDARKAFAEVKIPWLLMTGTHDNAAIGDATVESRLAVFPALPPGGKYELVLDGAEHNAFGDRALPGEHRPRNPNHHRAILGLSTAFWDTWLCDNVSASAWLDGSGALSVLAPGDRWQKK